MRSVLTTALRRASHAVAALVIVAATGWAAFEATPARAEGVTVGDIEISNAWGRAAPRQMRVGGVFFTMTNHGDSDDRLLSASAPVSEVAELHTHKMVNGVMRMRPVSAIDLPAGETVTLQPGGLHVMLINLKQSLEMGSSFPLTLNFEKAGQVQVTVEVNQPAGGMGQMKHGKHGMKGMKGMNAQ